MALCIIRCGNLLRLRPFISEQLIFLRKISINDKLRRNENLGLNQLIENSEKCDAAKWSCIRDELIQTVENVNEINVDNIIVNRCCDAIKPLVAFDYINYLIKVRKTKLNMCTVGKYFKLLHNNKKSVDGEEKERIFEYYDKIRAEHSNLDSFTAEYCLLGLSLTDRWKECLELLDMIEFSSNSRAIAYSAIVSAAFDHDELELGWDYLEKMSPRLKPNLRVYNAYLNYCRRTQNNLYDMEKATDKMFDYWMRNDIYPNLDIVTAYVVILSNTKLWTHTPTIVKNDGTCLHCKNRLPEIHLDKEDFDYFSKYFFHRALVGKDVFTKTTPGELNAFKKYVEQIKPYDVVIDGLNAAYAMNRQSKIPNNRAKELRKIATTFIERNKKVFILGRKHMHNWSPTDMDYIKKNCFIFLLNNLSNDDVFILYATLSSGIDTFIATRDFMREHKVVLEDTKLKRIFRHWQMTRQIFPVYVGLGQMRRMTLIYPPLYAPTAHKDLHGWHLPYCDVDEEQTNQPFERPTKWICLRKRVPIIEKITI